MPSPSPCELALRNKPEQLKLTQEPRGDSTDKTMLQHRSSTLYFGPPIAENLSPYTSANAKRRNRKPPKGSRHSKTI
eukprot:10795947-Lingulodinium_polyedra.AAC.1